MIFPPARPAAAAAAAGSRASRWGGRQQQQRAGVARSGQVSFGHLYGALRPPCWPLCALGAVEELTTANPSPSPPPPRKAPGPLGPPCVVPLGLVPGGGGRSRATRRATASRRHQAAPHPAGGGPHQLGCGGRRASAPCPFLVQLTRPDVSSSAQTQGRSLHSRESSISTRDGKAD